MNKEELMYPQNGEASTVTGSAGTDHHRGKFLLVNFNRTFPLILKPYSCKISATIMTKICIRFYSWMFEPTIVSPQRFHHIVTEKSLHLSMSVKDIVIPPVQTYTSIFE